MIKKLLALALSMIVSIGAFAAADANKASQAELEAIKGVGPAIATKILDERKKGAFKDWNDMVERVKGIGEGNAAKFSTEGLTVNGAGFKGAAAAKKDDKPVAAKVEEKKAAPAAVVAPAPAAMPAKADDKKAATAAAPMAKADDKKMADKPMTADDKKAAKAAAAAAKKKEKEDKMAAKAAKPADAKASDAKK